MSAAAAACCRWWTAACQIFGAAFEAFLIQTLPMNVGLLHLKYSQRCLSVAAAAAAAAAAADGSQ
jgi:hypothetical protein